MVAQKTFTILLVDDNAVNREIGLHHLQHQGYQVELAADGDEALHTARYAPIDLVLLDVIMPGINGLEVLRTLRQLYPAQDLPVIMATAKSDSADMVQAFELGANDYVTKPLDWEVVGARIRAQLRSSTPRQQSINHTSSPAPIEPGTVLEDKYQLESLIGHGNYGAVYRAMHLPLKRAVAVKVLNTAIAAEEDWKQRFQREGISTCRIQHPNAVKVLDFNVDDHGRPFLVMELLQGESLEDEFRRHKVFTPTRCHAILQPICDVLTEAHAQGVIHRDIKPQNIFLHRGSHGEIVKVVDFGIAKIVDEATMDYNLTAENNQPGTPAYMAPERFLTGSYDGQVDVYSLGIMLYEMLTGTLPFTVDDGNLLNVIRMHLSKEPAPLRLHQPDIPQQIEQVVLRAIAKDAAARPTPPQLAETFAEALLSPSTRR